MAETATPATGATAPTTPSPGYWLAGADGGVFAFGVPYFGSGSVEAGPGACTFTPQWPSTLDGALVCVAAAGTPAGSGYFLVDAHRFVTSFGGVATH